MTTTWTEADIAALEAAIKSGRQRVRFGHREHEYQTVDQMLKLLATMKDSVASATGTSSSRTTYGSFSKGRRRLFADES